MVAAVVLIAGVVIPRPITVTGPFAVAPALSVPLTAPDSGHRRRVYVREGTRVEAGMPLLAGARPRPRAGGARDRRRADSLAAREARRPARPAGRTRSRGSKPSARPSRPGSTGMSAEQRVLTVRALVPGIVVTPRPEQLAGRWVELGERLIELGQPDSLELRIALAGAGATQVRAGQPVRLVFHADAAHARRHGHGRGPSSSGRAPARSRPALACAAARMAAGHDRRGQRHAPAVEPVGGAVVGRQEAGEDGSFCCRRAERRRADGGWSGEPGQPSSERSGPRANDRRE